MYFFIQTTNVFTDEIIISCTQDGAARKIVDKDKWKQWWPGNKQNENIYSFGHYNYRIDKILLNGFETTVYDNKDSAKAALEIFSSGIDSSQFLLTSTYKFSADPAKRLIQFFHFKTIKANLKDLAASIEKYFQQEKNIYGIQVLKQKVTDSSLIAVKQKFPRYPSTEEIYDMINSLKEYIREKGGEENNYPMLNVHQEKANLYEAMVAIPTKGDLPSEGKFQLKKMVLGNILMAEVRGGTGRILEGEQELTNYVYDHQKLSPAIPYQSLVTNRLTETDTSKWITRLYYPVFY